MSRRARKRASLILALAAALTLVASALFFYADRAFLRSDGFADRAEASIASKPVRDLIGAAGARAIVEANPNAIAVKPVLETTIASAVGTAPIRRSFRAAAGDLHRAVIEGDQNSVVFILNDIGAALAGALSTAAPETAEKIPDDLDARLLAADDRAEQNAVAAARAVERFAFIRWLLLALALGLGAGAIATSPSRRLGVGRVAWSLAATALTAAFCLLVARHFFVGQFDATVSDAAGAAWDAFVGTAYVWLLVLALIGVVGAAAAASALKPVDLDGSLARAWTFVSRPRESTIGRAVHAAAWLITGLAIVANRGLFIDLVALAIGSGVIYIGAAELMRLTIARDAEPLPAAPRQVARTAASGAAKLIRLGTVAAVLIGAGIGLAALFAGSGAELKVSKPDACNGLATLCDRPVDRVAFAGTHNAMSAASNPDWLFAQQERGLGTQLDDGIRALLIDTHYGLKNSRGVVTDLARGAEDESKLEAALGPEATQAAERLRNRISGSDGEPGVYLCHGFCELGAINAAQALSEVRKFLDRNPGEVVLISVEDATSAADTAKAFEEAGLRDYVYEGPNGPPWPTLGELIGSGTQLVVMAERHGGGEPAWLRDQFSIVKETPYTFKTVEALTEKRACEPNRGKESGSIFLINHWVDTSPAPKPTNARRANTTEMLRERVERCREARGALPGILAVDFYREGDVVDFVADLNRDRDRGG